MDDLASLFLFLRTFPNLTYTKLKSLCRSLASDAATSEAFTYLCLKRSQTVVKFPPRKDIAKRIKFWNQEVEEYKAINTDIVRVLSGTDRSNSSTLYSDVLVKINSLRQVCNLGIEYRRKNLRLAASESSGQLSLDHLLSEILSSGAARCLECGIDVSESPFSQDYEDGIKHEVSLMASCGSIICSGCSKSKQLTSAFNCLCSLPDPCTYTPVSPAQAGQFDHMSTIKIISSKTISLMESIKEIPQNDEALVFSFWTTSLDMVEQALNLASIQSTRLEGPMSSKQRQISVEKFNTDPNISVLMSLRCGCNGLNLTVANYVYLMEPQ